MNYTASVTDFFRSPKWPMNLLMAGLCTLIPIIGPIVVMGWLIIGFWARTDEDFRTFPEFDFGQFKLYLERGVWPFLVAFLASLLMIPIVMVVWIPMMVLVGFFASAQGEHGNGCVVGLVWVLACVFYIAMLSVMALVIAPLKARASLVQEFAKSFDFAFVRRFIALTWKEIILSWFFMMFASLVLGVVGMLLLCVGIYFEMVPVYFCWVHLNKQLYRLYLERGGERVAPSPKLLVGEVSAAA
jgi:hypothetical protein